MARINDTNTYPLGTPTGTDRIPFISDPAGTPVLKQATVANLKALSAVGFDTGSTGGTLTTTSTSLGDLTGVAVTLAAAENDRLYMNFCAHGYNPGASAAVFTTFVVGSTNVRGSTNTLCADLLDGYTRQVSMQWLHTVAAGDISGGNVTVKVQWKTEGGTASFWNDTTVSVPTLWVMNLGQ